MAKVRANRFGFKDTEFLKTVRARFLFADTSSDKQRQRELDDLSFYAGNHWPADIKAQRQGQQPNQGMPAVPSRPTLVIDNLREPVSQVVNEGVNSDLGVEITAAEDFGDLGVVPDDTEIKLREGLIRKIQRESQARDARMWAFDRAVKAGRGYYLVNIRFLPGKTWDQEIFVERIYNQACVLLDPSHQEPDGSDCEFEFTHTDMLWDTYIAQFPLAADGRENGLDSGYSDSDWAALGDEYPNWFKLADDTGSKDKKTRSVRVVNYWYTDHESRELCVLTDGSLVWKDELQDGAEIADSRFVVEKKIKFCKIDGAQILEQTDWPGPDMPIIKVMGEEMQPYDGEHRAEGMVRPARDSQMGLDVMISKQVEMVGLTPLTPLVTDPDAIEGFPEWDQINTRVVPYGRYRSYDDQGRQLREPHRPNADPNLLPISQSIALFSAQTEKQTRVPAARLGDIDPVTRSGKALDRLTANSKNSTSTFAYNLYRSVRYEGTVENNLLFPVYGKVRNGRLVRAMTGSGASKKWLVHDNPEAAQQDPKLSALIARAEAVAKLTPDASFNINVKVTRDSDTKRQEEHAVLGELIGADPQAMMGVLGDLFFQTMDTPAHQEMAERMRVMLVPQVQQYLDAKEQGQALPTPREMALHAENTQLKQIAQQQGMELQTDAAANRTKLQDRAMQEQSETLRNRENNETKLAVSELGAKFDRLALFLEERARLGIQSHEAAMSHAQSGMESQEADAQRQHEQQMAQQDQTHQVGMAHAQAGTDAAQADQDRQFQAQQAAQEPEAAGV